VDVEEGLKRLVTVDSHKPHVKKFVLDKDKKKQINTKENLSEMKEN
jgi:hypothetical protein